MNKKMIQDVDVKGKRVLMRVDFNVPMNDQEKLLTINGLPHALPSIQYLVEQGAKVILMSHFGRPKGKVVDSMRMDPIAEHLGRLLGKTVIKADDCIGPEVEAKAAEMQDGDVMLLENVRFYAEEEATIRNLPRN